MIVSASEIVESRFYIIDIPPISEWLDSTQGGSKGTGGRENFAPRIVGISYHLVSVAVNQTQYVALQIYNRSQNAMAA